MGVILVFLKGEPEITMLLKSLEDTGWGRLPFHSELETEQQDEVQELGPEACRIVVAATNMAETSLTLQPMTTVISSCRVNRKSVGPDGLPRVCPYWASKREVRQQGGRAGRLREGRQLLTVTLASLPDRRPADITTCSDYDWLIWKVASAGYALHNLDWMPGERPSELGVARACATLKTPGARATSAHLLTLKHKVQHTRAQAYAHARAQ